MSKNYAATLYLLAALALATASSDAFSQSAQNTALTYYCVVPRNRKVIPPLNKFTLTLYEERAWIQHSGAPQPILGRLNPKYKPRTNVSFYKYEGFMGAVSDPQSPRPSILIERTLLGGGVPQRNGRFGGILKVQDSLGGMWIEHLYVCER